MKTDYEERVISDFCSRLCDLFQITGNHCSLKYDNRTEMVVGSVNNVDVKISVGLSSITASARDIVRGIAGALNDKY